MSNEMWFAIGVVLLFDKETMPRLFQQCNRKMCPM